MRVAISGASGLIGRALTQRLAANGHDVVVLVRSVAGAPADAIAWSATQGTVDAEGLAKVDAVVHLAGEPIGDRRWNDQVKTRILESRTRGTHVLAKALADLDHGPRIFVSASAIGYYGNRASEVLTESSSPGSGFLAEVCTAWEAAAQPAVDAGLRVVHPRTGIVLTAQGGALAKMLLPFKLALGGRIGSGRQFMSWISLSDEVAALEHLLTSELAGPVNLVGPAPVDNATFTTALGAALGRPSILPLPAAAIKLALGEMGEALVLDSQRVLPERLLADGFEFAHGDIGAALRWAVTA